MRARHLAIMLLAVLMLAACSTAQPSPSGTPNPTAVANPSPSALPSPSAAPVEPTTTPTTTPTTEPTQAPPTKNERFLLAGVRDDAAIDCAPRRTDLPPRAIAGVECTPQEEGVERLGVYLFKSEAAAYATYTERMAAEGVELNSGTCYDGEAESGYVPGEDEREVTQRGGCFLNEFGTANYRAIVDGTVYVGLLGTSGNTRALEDFAWKFNQDVPGAPTIWSSANS